MTKKMMMQVKEKIRIFTDNGIDIEIKDFFKNCENIKSYDINIENMVYEINVKLNNFTLIETKKVFSSFLRFIEYSGGSFYIRKTNNNEVLYLLISFDEDLEGFYCELKFY